MSNPATPSPESAPAAPAPAAPPPAAPEPQAPPLEKIVWELTPAEAQMMLNALQQFTVPLANKVMGQAQTQFREHEEAFKKKLSEEKKNNEEASKAAADALANRSQMKAVPK